jgi:putative NADPH-quinone reductase
MTIKASVILAHPHEGSFNHAIYMTINETLKLCGVIAFSHDLYKEKFDPVLTGKELGTDISEDVQGCGRQQLQTKDCMDRRSKKRCY